MKFTQWLEAQNSINISFSSDGTTIVHVNGRKYVYRVKDVAYTVRWQEQMNFLARSKPAAYNRFCFGILNKLKDWVNKGYAEQLEPLSKPPEPPQYTQKTLF